MVSVEVKQELAYARWESATWADYQRLRDDPTIERVQLFFAHNRLLVENMGWEGILHSEIRELMTLILGTWLMRHPDMKSKLLGSCLMEREGLQAAAPDIALYMGECLPQYQASRRIDLNQCPRRRWWWRWPIRLWIRIWTRRSICMRRWGCRSIG